jgi:RepB DNA-primase from phage plasmid
MDCRRGCRRKRGAALPSRSNGNGEPMSEPIPQDAALKLQLAGVAGSEPETSLFEFRTLDRDGRPGPRKFIPVRDLDAGVAWALAQADNVNVYVGAAPRVREDGTAAAVERIWTLWADCDGAESLKRLREFRPTPNIVLRSGSPESVHAWWSLSKALSPAGAQRANRRLALALAADMKATDPARILRCAGTLNHKHDPPARVECVRLELDVFKLADVVRSLPDSDHYAPRPRRQFTGDMAKSVAGLVTAVAEAQQGNRNAILFWAACTAREDGLDAREELHHAALEAGLGEFEIERTLDSAERRAAA